MLTRAARGFASLSSPQGQPALLYLVPGVVGFQLLRSVLTCDFQRMWSGSALPQPPANLSGLACDACHCSMFLDELVWSDEKKNVDYCARCAPSGLQSYLSALAPFLLSFSRGISPRRP